MRRADAAVTPAQADCLAAVREVHAATGRATVRAVAARLDRCLATAHQHLVALRRQGLVRWEDGEHGTLRPAEPKLRPTKWVPLLSMEAT